MDKAKFLCTKFFFIAGSNGLISKNITSVYKPFSLVRKCHTTESGHLKLAQANSSNVQGNNGNPIGELTLEEEKKLKVLKLEFDVFYSTGVLVPSAVSEKEWIKVLRSCPSVNLRKKYYNYLFKNEKSTLNKKTKAQANIKAQLEKQLEIERLRNEGLLENFKNTFLLFLQMQTVNRFHYNNLIWAMLHGPKLVFDFGFEEHMSEHEIKDLVKQVFQCHGTNKAAKEPFYFHFCGLQTTSDIYARIDNVNIENLPITISPDSYLNYYPKERLVYLSPNANEVLTTFNHDDVYIIGSIVDKANELPLTMAKAKREGIRMVKFPLDRYVKWVQGSKSLPLNHVVEILHKIKLTQDWENAITSSLPSRKFMQVKEEARREKQKYGSFARKSFEKTRSQHKRTNFEQ